MARNVNKRKETDMKQLNQLSKWLIAIALVFVITGLARAQDDEEGRIGDWVFRPDASLPMFKIDFEPTRVTFNEAGIGIGGSVTRETGSVFDPKFALYLFPKSKMESEGMDLAVGAEVSFLSVGRFHLFTLLGMWSITEEEASLGVGVSAGLMK